jgi:methionyl-tRNA formyltransferase
VRVVFMGSPPFAGPVFHALLTDSRLNVVALVTRPDKPRGRGMTVRENAVTLAARTRNIAVLQPERARGPEFVESLRRLDVDVAVVASFGQILKQDVLELPRHGCLNVHASLLPRHRGASPIQAAILAGDTETGVSVQRMVLALDEGDVLVERRTPIGAHENAGDLLSRLAVLGGEAAVSALDQIGRGIAHYTPQAPERATYAPKIVKDAGIVDWSKSAQEIERLVRAFTPWPGARTTYAGVDITLLDVRVGGQRQLDDTLTTDTPGTIVRKWPSEMLVACGQGTIEIRALRPAGKNRMDAGAWVNGARVEVGARFGAS